MKRFLKKPCERIQNLTEKEKKQKKWEYDCERYKNCSEGKKQKLVEYIKKYYVKRKNN